MKELVNLIRSENMKIYFRKSTWVMVGFLILAVILSAATTWRIGVNDGIWGLVAGQISALFLVDLFTVIVAAGIVATEYHWGTIKLLLIRPVNRGRILFAKYLSLILFGLFLMMVLFGTALTVNGLLFTIKSGSGAELLGAVLPGKKLWFDSFGGATLLYTLRFAEVAVYATFAFMLSTISKSSAFTIGISIFTMLFGPEFANMLSGKPWGKYILFANLDLSRYLKNNPNPWPGMSPAFSTLVLIGYGLVFYLISRTFFIKRDVLS
ncbi:MAG TPA: ABC transporter permease [Bacillota bacterium]